MSNSLWPRGLQHTRLPCPSLSSRGCSNSYSLSQWCCLTISFSAAQFYCLQSFSASGSFSMSQLFTSGGQSTGAFLPMNIQGLFQGLGLTGLISLLFKELSKVFSSTIRKHQFFGTKPSLRTKVFSSTIRKYQFFGTKPSLRTNSHVHRDKLVTKKYGMEWRRWW